ncbi:MAG: 8-oxo-dGTP diphosphatase MutT [Aeromonas sp.]
MTSSTKRIWVAVGVIENDRGEVFIARRAPSQHQGERWEFPGGKVEAGEDLHQALDRELFEELGIRVLDSQPFLELSHDYADKKVLLDVWRVPRFSGEPYGKEGQLCRWVAIADLHQYPFPAANTPIVAELQAAIGQRRASET